MKLYFVYSVPPVSGLQRIIRFMRRHLNSLGIPIGLLSRRQPTKEEMGKWPVKSPYTNTKYIYEALSGMCPAYLYHLTENIHINFESDDVFLGHPYFPFHPKRIGVTEHAVVSKNRPRILALITPLHCNLEVQTSHINKAFLDHVDNLLPHADVLFGIMGEYWWDQWDKSIYSHWKSKMVRLDMAVDVARYPYVRKGFNPPGKRRFLFIGRNDPMKGVGFLKDLAAKMKSCEFGWIGEGADIPGVKRISPGRALDPVFMTKVAEEYDVFISPSAADPNPTTILESMAWGFPVAATQQSGYYETATLRNIFSHDLDRSVRVLESFQNMSDKELMCIASEARKIVETDYSWGKLTRTILSSLSSRSGGIS